MWVRLQAAGLSTQSSYQVGTCSPLPSWGRKQAALASPHCLLGLLGCCCPLHLHEGDSREHRKERFPCESGQGPREPRGRTEALSRPGGQAKAT